MKARYIADEKIRHRDVLRLEVEEAKKRLDKIRRALNLAEEDAGQKDVDADRAQAASKEAEKSEPDTALLKEQIKAVERINYEVRQNKKRDEVIAQNLKTCDRANQMSLKIGEIDKEKTRMLDEAVFPIDGLSLDEDTVTFNDIPLDQASTAEQLRVSVAIGLALNPELRVILVRDGNALDSDSMKAIAQQAADADAQLWLERVAESKDGVSVMIEDGSVV